MSVTSPASVRGLVRIATVLVICMAAATVLAGEPMAANEEAARPEIRQRFIAEMRLARRGDSAAQYAVGRAYLDVGDFRAARSWLSLAAESGELRAATQLGVIHEHGLGVEASVDEAIRWYRRGALGDEAFALVSLGRLLLRTKGAVGAADARALFERAAEAGDAAGQYYLAIMLADGIAGRPDNAAAYRWFRRAAEQGHVAAKVSVGVSLLRGLGVEGKEVDRITEARRWFADAAAAGDPFGSYYLALDLARGVATERSLGAAIAAFRVAAQAGHREAQFELARLLESATDKSLRPESAHWYREAANAGHGVAMNRLGELHRDGHWARQDDFLARELFMKSSGLGQTRAMYNAALLIDAGRGGARDSELSLRLLSRAAEAGDEDAQDSIDRILGVDTRFSQATRKGFWQR